jgi:hypothetical protein
MWFRTIHALQLLPGGHTSFLHDAARSTAPERVRQRGPRTALITGASGGIGLELARLFAEDHHNLVLVARDREKLLALAAELESRHGITVTTIPKDLAATDAVEQIVADLRQRSIAVDMLVNNAGFATSGPFAQTDAISTVQLLQVNVVALTHLTRVLLPGMVARRSGRILNIASVAAYVPGPLTACYNASKAFVISFSAALANELRDAGVTVTALCPGPTDTHFAERAGLTESKAFSRNVMDAATVARSGYDAMMAGKMLEIPGLRNKLRMLPLPLVPRRVLAHFSRKYHERVKPVEARGIRVQCE